MGYKEIAIAIMLGYAVRAVYYYFNESDEDRAERERKKRLEEYHNRSQYYYHDYRSDYYQRDYYQRDYYQRDWYEDEDVPSTSVSTTQESRQQTNNQSSISVNNTQRNVRTAVQPIQTGYQRQNTTTRIVQPTVNQAKKTQGNVRVKPTNQTGYQKQNDAKRPKKKRVRKFKKCSICLNDIKRGGKILVECGHKFHVHCIALWLEEHETCPNCRMIAY